MILAGPTMCSGRKLPVEEGVRSLLCVGGDGCRRQRMAGMGTEVQMTAVTPGLREVPGECSLSCFLKAEPRDDFSDVTEA